MKDLKILDSEIRRIIQMKDSTENTSRISRDKMFCDIVDIISHRSTCLRSRVGALIVKDGRIISIGYNGPAAGQPECEELPWGQWGQIDSYLKKNPLVCMGAGCNRSIHAELNAIVFAARVGVPVKDCTMYCSMSPCINCAKAIVNSGISELVYQEDYRKDEGLKLLKECGILVRKLGDPSKQKNGVKFVESKD